MNHTPLEELVSPTQLANLRKLFDYVRDLVTQPEASWPHKFNMSWYGTVPTRDTASPSDFMTEDHSCGTSCCLAGYGIAAGITYNPSESWSTYVGSKFGSNNNSLYYWLFAGGWYYIDNTLEGATKRLGYALTRGVPEFLNSHSSTFKQMFTLYQDFPL